MVMKWVKLSLVACVVGLSGVGSVVQASEVVSAVVSAPCCATYADMPFMPLPNSEFEYKFELNERSPAFAFADGVSYFQTFQLPAQGRDFKFRVSSTFGKAVLIPVVQLLDRDLKVVREIKGTDFTVDYGNLGRKVYLTATFEVDNGNTSPISFLVVKADSSTIGGETQIMSAARKWAKETGLAQPVDTDPVIPHSLTGELELQMEVSGFRNEVGKASTVGEATLGSTAAVAVTTTVGAVAVVTKPAVVPTQPKQQMIATNQQGSAASVSSIASTSAAMLAETEAFYNQQIIKAISSGDIEKAMALTNEAERAGSQTAKKTFVDAIKSSQH
jgi:maltose operon periplasmic protein